MSGISLSRASSGMAMRLKMRGGQGKREVGDEGRDMKMRGTEEGEGRIIWGKKGRGEENFSRAPLQEERKEVRARGECTSLSTPQRCLQMSPCPCLGRLGT